MDWIIRSANRMVYSQLDLAKRLNLPAIIHSRHSDEDMLAIYNTQM